jgi:hypothetical protein
MTVKRTFFTGYYHWVNLYSPDNWGSPSGKGLYCSWYNDKGDHKSNITAIDNEGNPFPEGPVRYEVSSECFLAVISRSIH